jgi:hypothetical protein
MKNWSYPGFLRYVYPATIAAVLLLALMEAVLQVRETRYVEAVARAICQRARATTPSNRALALRDYLRAHVSYADYDQQHRPFLRASAAETLRSGRGYCGEATRAFICLARGVGIPAQRINLIGSEVHTVAEASVGPGERLIIDSLNTPGALEAKSLDEIIRLPQYDDYSTLNLRRLHLNWLFSRIKLEMGPITYWSENPHALRASMWLLLALGMLGLRGGRVLLRHFLHRRGWIHRTNLRTLEAPGSQEANTSGSAPATEPAPAVNQGAAAR